jgi:soluble lytic murein transglycosylase-like protein
MESLFEPRLNIQLGTAYFKDQIDKYDRLNMSPPHTTPAPTRGPMAGLAAFANR